jgi:hypothetical protein
MGPGIDCAILYIARVKKSVNKDSVPPCHPVTRWGGEKNEIQFHGKPSTYAGVQLAL